MATTLEQVAAELYALPLEEFIAARGTLAKALRAEDGELSEAVAKLPKPALSAWAVDRLARLRPDDLDDLLALGEQLREAQEERAADRVKSLTGNAQALVRRTVRAVVEVAEVSLSDALLGQVEQTLRAAMADEEAAAVVRAGVLARPLEPAGFGPVDLSGAVAVIPAVRPARERERRLAVVRPSGDDRARAARQAAEQALARLERGEADLADRDDALRAAQEQHEKAAHRRDELRAEVTEAEKEEQAAARRVREARKEQERAARQAARLAEGARKAGDPSG
jgi:hypothetical protein